MRVFIFIGLLLQFAYCFSQADSTKIKELLDKAFALEKINRDSAITTYNSALKLALENEYWLGAGRATSYTGIVYSDHGIYDSAIVYHKKSIPFYEKAKYSDGATSSLINLANVYQFQGNYQNSVDYYLKGIEAYEKMKDTVRLIYAYGNYASLFTDFKMFDKAEKYQSLALDFSYKTGDSISVGYILNDLALTYINIGKKSDALKNLKRALSIAESQQDTELMYFSNKDLYYFYDNNNEIKNAKTYALRSYQNALKTQNPYYISYSLISLGNVYWRLKELDSAYFYSSRALEKAKQIEAKEMIKDSYKNLTEIYNEKQDYKKAFNALQLYIAYQDSVIGQQNKEYISRLEQQYQVKNKDNEILQQQLVIEKNKSLIQRKRNQNAIYLISAIILLFTSFILWYRHRQKQKLNNQKILTLNKEKELASLEALIEGEDQERSRIAKDLHDSVNGNLSAIKHNLSSIQQKSIKQEDLKTFHTAIDMLDNACEQIRNISHDLVPPSLLNYGLIEALEQYINRVNEMSILDISFQHFGKVNSLNKKIETTIYHIIQELITNIVKHSKAEKGIVQINANKDILHITVEDDGKGYDTVSVSHGLGLNNIKSRVEFLNAEMEVKSDSNGTSNIITIDLNKIET